MILITKSIEIYCTKKISWLCIVIGLFSGCAGVQQFPDNNANSSQAALNALIERYSSITTFNADAGFDFVVRSDDDATDKYRLTLDGTVSFDKANGWEIEITGPLGVKFAILHSKNGRYQLNTPQTGQIKEGALDDGLFIPELELMLPAISSLDVLFLPTIPLKRDDFWSVDRTAQPTDNLMLRRDIAEGSDGIELALEYSPLIVHKEKHYRDSEMYLQRSFGYPSASDNVPNSVLLEFDQMLININYSSIVLN